MQSSADAKVTKNSFESFSKFKRFFTYLDKQPLKLLVMKFYIQGFFSARR